MLDLRANAIKLFWDCDRSYRLEPTAAAKLLLGWPWNSQQAKQKEGAFPPFPWPAWTPFAGPQKEDSWRKRHVICRISVPATPSRAQKSNLGLRQQSTAKWDPQYGNPRTEPETQVRTQLSRGDQQGPSPFLGYTFTRSHCCVQMQGMSWVVSS